MSPARSLASSMALPADDANETEASEVSRGGTGSRRTALERTYSEGCSESCDTPTPSREERGDDRGDARDDLAEWTGRDMAAA